MMFVKGRCKSCNGNLFWDEEDGTVRCLACGMYASHNAEKVLIRHPNGMPMKIITPASRLFDNLR
jgi:hypothetical protein